jgi:hypothetical protein
MTSTPQERRAIALHPSLNRPRLIMGMDVTLFMALTLAVVFLVLGFQLRPLPTGLGLAQLPGNAWCNRLKLLLPVSQWFSENGLFDDAARLAAERSA